MSHAPCPFCSPKRGSLLHEDHLTIGLWDAFPVNDGHALLIPRRHVASWFDATADEQAALIRAIHIARGEFPKKYEPDGLNIGINVGSAAGQTVFHLHVHVIPRYEGDVPDPRGGIRHVIPAKANCLRPELPPESFLATPHARNLVLKQHLDAATQHKRHSDVGGDCLVEV